MSVDINGYRPRIQGAVSQVKSAEHGCEHIGRNPGGQYVRQYRIDGDVLPVGKSPLRCDYLV